ncbi:AI-2E family transporter [Micromonospora sp. BRA006-A]|nr:AI-2E family transporter [Micromonospora sp. BRA006-A]
MSAADDRSIARRTLIVIGLVLATGVGLALVWATRRVLVWGLVAVFFAVALKPLVDRLERRVRRRALATPLVFLAAFALLSAVAALIVVPLVDEVGRFADRAPDLVREAQAGQGPLGRLLDRFHLLRYAEPGQLRRYGARLGDPTVGVVRSVAQAVAAVVTVVVLAYLMVLEAPKIVAATLRLTGDGAAARLRRIGRDSSRIVTGYLSGNLLISVICGGLTFVVLFLLGVPFAAVIALTVAVFDLIPLVGATLGALAAAGAAFLHSPTAGLVVLVFFVVYQQVENHLLQPVIMGRAVRLNPLTVLVTCCCRSSWPGWWGRCWRSRPPASCRCCCASSRRPGGRPCRSPPTAIRRVPSPAGRRVTDRPAGGRGSAAAGQLR